MTPSRLGPYPIEREVGRGGMGVVYRGRDTRLDRPVAIKVLPEQLARDPERLARFEREARLLASLSHPNVAGIYGLEDADGVRFLALEYVEGDTLAQRLKRGPLPLDDTLDVCCQIAHALEAAHEAGIVHRDLKPGNVKLTPAGAVKVLDFGLAKSSGAASDSNPDLTHSPTMTVAATAVGVILGTAAYMSPEQARGKAVDRRTDIWSFGCVLYECLTGKMAFSGETVSDVIAQILQGEPDWKALPAQTPGRLRHLLARCLERDPRQRLRDIGDARVELEELQGKVGPSSSGAHAASASLASVAAARASRVRAVAVGALLLLAGAAAGAAVWNAIGTPRRPDLPLRFAIQAPASLTLDPDPNQLAISPDGRMLAFRMLDSTGSATLWLRRFEEFDASVLPGTDDAELPFWSPDGRYVGFFAEGKLKRIRVGGGNPEVICNASNGRGASWNANDVIVFGPGPTGPLYRVSASGGTPVPVTAIDSTLGENGHRWPCFLPDGEHFLYAALPTRDGSFSCYIGSLTSMARDTLLSAATAPVYAAPGYVLFSRNGALVAQRFDPRRRALIGDPMTVGKPPAPTSFSAGPGASVSTNGLLAWTAAGSGDTRLVWLDRSGREVDPIDVPHDRWGFAVLSRDGRFALAEKELSDGNSDLWLIDLEREVANRITAGGAKYTAGTFSPDGHMFAYGSTERGHRDLYVRRTDGSGPPSVLYASPVPYKDPIHWTEDGRWITVSEISDDTGWNIMLLPAEGGTLRPFATTPFSERFGIVSPDGAWMAYTSDETGSPQAFVQAFPDGGMKQQVTRSGGLFAVWRRDGRELLILRPDFSVVSVSVTPGRPPTFGPARELFRLDGTTLSVVPRLDGQRFLAIVPAVRSVPEISVAVNWRAGLEE